MVSAWPLFVEGHDDHRGTVASGELCAFQEQGLAVFEADAVEDGLALHALQAGFQDLPAGRVDDDGHPRDVRARTR